MQACRRNTTFLDYFLHISQGLKFFNNILLSVKNIQCCDCTPHLSSNPMKKNCGFMRRRISETLYVAKNISMRIASVSSASTSLLPFFFTTTAYLASTHVYATQFSLYKYIF